MKRHMSAKSRLELMQALGERYRLGSRLAKERILDEFVAVTGYRKHAIRLLRLGCVGQSSVKPARPRRYGDAVGEALVVLWEAADRVCGKRLKVLIPTLVEALGRHGHLRLDAGIRERLLFGERGHHRPIARRSPKRRPSPSASPAGSIIHTEGSIADFNIRSG